LLECSKVYQEEPAATIACFNGPRSFTVAGPSNTIDHVAEILRFQSKFSSIKAKKLNITNAFHSSLVDPLIEQLEQLGQTLNFKEPMIHWERAVNVESREPLTARFVADHMRSPVYFHHAVQRLSKRFESCIWLEAGSNSTITAMTSKAIGLGNSSHFQAINITAEGSFQLLTDAIVNLWKQGLNVSYWSHNATQSIDYPRLLLPPYQFEKSRHWMELKKPQKGILESSRESQNHEKGRAITKSGAAQPGAAEAWAKV